MSGTRVAALATMASVWLAVAAASLAENWPQFRGPTGQGHSRESDLPVRWGGPERLNVLWEAPLVGQGHASPIVWGERVFVCTVHWPAEVQKRETVMPEHHVLCYDARDGKLVWDAKVPAGPWLRSDFRSGPGGGYAAPTPATDGKRVYVAFGSAVLAALDFEGKLVWRRELTPASFDVTVGSSPVLCGSNVILLCAMAQRKDSHLAAFEAAGGEVAWRTPMPETAFGHSTPLLIRVNGKDQLIAVASGAAASSHACQSFDPADGKRLWWCRGAGDVASAVFGGGLVYFDSGRGGKGVAVDAGGSGEVTATHVRWNGPSLPQSLASPLIVGPHVYRLRGNASLECWKLADGSVVWSQKLEGLSSTWASPVADAKGRIYVATAGKSYVLQAGAEPRVLAVNDLGDGNHPSPAVSNGRIFLVGAKSVWCVGNPKP
ncbi:MAG: outer membrane biogenesis protein BamB [Planctomycetes bacterium ADurb.Bin126]|nr:MAG: outer membrane biogenesis protein BamB [Planctomycetes bacterium ADurb.Bin126]HOD81479.1 PQQ-like beta-propeller repeat protein [Phycisphaerae bacterium]